MALSGPGSISELPEFRRKLDKKLRDLDRIGNNIWIDLGGLFKSNPLTGLYTKGKRKGFKQESGRINKIKKRNNKIKICNNNSSKYNANCIH